MSDEKTTNLSSITGANLADNDLVMVVDVSDTTMAATGTNKKVTLDEFAQDSTFSSRYVPQTSDVTFIPAGAFSITSGSPTIGGYGTAVVTWGGVLFDASSAEYVSSFGWLPAHWNTFHIDLYWTNPGPGSGDVRWAHYYRTFADGDATGVISGGESNITAGTEDTLKISRVGTSVSLTRGRPLFLVIGRVAADAADTLGNDAAMIGVALVRAS